MNGVSWRPFALRSMSANNTILYEERVRHVRDIYCSCHSLDPNPHHLALVRISCRSRWLVPLLGFLYCITFWRIYYAVHLRFDCDYPRPRTL